MYKLFSCGYKQSNLVFSVEAKISLCQKHSDWEVKKRGGVLNGILQCLSRGPCYIGCYVCHLCCLMISELK